MNLFEGEADAHICYVPELKAPGKSRNISPGERATLAYLRYMIIEKKFLSYGDVLIIDGETALCTEAVQLYLSEYGISPFVLPSALHQLLNPCDNSFHSLFKQRYYRLISNLNNGAMNLKEKFHLAKQCFHEISEESVRNMFSRCGLIPSTFNTRTIINSLMSEGIKSLDKNGQHHKLCLLSYLKWCKHNSLFHLCPVRINF
jgi:hypothetical protein